jgi:hypothetical protein
MMVENIIILPRVQEELRSVVYSMEIGKGPRPVGFPIDFYQKLWHIISRDLLAAAEESRVSGKILKDINSPFSTHSKVESRNGEDFI